MALIRPSIPHQPNKAHTKAHKRFVKHAMLLARLHRTASTSKITKQRRPSKKLVTNLADLEDALPSTSLEGSRIQGQPLSLGKVKQKSLRSRPGAMKRKEKIMMAERERFAKNLALLAASQTSDATNERIAKTEAEKHEEMREISTSNNSRARWAAIRDHIGKTMEVVDHTNISS